MEYGSEKTLFGFFDASSRFCLILRVLTVGTLSCVTTFPITVSKFGSNVTLFRTMGPKFENNSSTGRMHDLIGNTAGS